LQAVLIILAAALGFAGSFYVSRHEAKKRFADEKRRLLARYQAQAAIVVARLRDLPEPAKLTVLGQILRDLEGEQASWVREQRAILKTLGADWRRPIEDFIATGAEARLLGLSPSTRAVLERVEDYVLRLTQDRTAELREEWSEIHAALDAAIHDEVGRSEGEQSGTAGVVTA
jgi:hypothetical protein